MLSTYLLIAAAFAVYAGLFAIVRRALPPDAPGAPPPLDEDLSPAESRRQRERVAYVRVLAAKGRATPVERVDWAGYLSRLRDIDAGTGA